jgi:hypothetical protein
MARKQLSLKLPPSIAGAKKTTTIAPKGSASPKPLPKIAGPMKIATPDGGFVKKPSSAAVEPPARRTTQVLSYLKDKLATVQGDPDYTAADKAKVEKAVEVEEKKVQESQAEYFQKLGQMEARREAAEEEAKAYKAAAKAAKARRLAGL